MFSRKLICAFSLACFKVCICKISDKSDTFSLNYSHLFRGPLFSGHSVLTSTLRHQQPINSVARNNHPEIRLIVSCNEINLSEVLRAT